MNKDTLITLLKIIASNGSVNPLRKKEYTHSQIAMLMQEAMQNEYVKMDDEVIKLTDKGENELARYYKEEKLHGSKKWIMPQAEYYVKPIDKFDIIFPKKI